ncbi:MAG TPA: tail fiber protein [Rhizomicrobium sp.]|nr:tail fiber protein [Rhizomicrobium sp.]
MSQPYVGQILMFAGTFAPAGWMQCQGQLIPISENDTLFNLIGTTYGGDGQETFGVPDLQGRIPIHQGTGGGLSTYVVGQAAGVESVTLNTNQIPSHNHLVLVNVGNAGNSQTSPGPSVILADAQVGGSNIPNPWAPYNSGAQTLLKAGTVGNTGGSQPHENIQPILTVTMCLSLFGVYPSPT